MEKIAVLMPAYNCQAYIAEAITSIIVQSYEDWELVIVDDGSTDGTAEVVSSFKDARIRYFRSARNGGVASALNYGLSIITAPYTARMDADDASMPERLERQRRHLEANPAIGVLGTGMRLMGTDEPRGNPVTDSRCRVALLENPPFAHPTVMYRTELVASVGYPEDRPHAEDYALWVKLARKTKFANLPESLLRYRLHAGQVSARHSERQLDSRVAVIRDYLVRELGLPVTEDEMSAHLGLIGTGRTPDIARVASWVTKLRDMSSSDAGWEDADLERFFADKLLSLLGSERIKTVNARLQKFASRIWRKFQ